MRCVNAIRFIAIDAVNKAKSGHPGLPMGCAPMTYVLWNETMKYNPKDPKWFNRDRFVLSAGHGSMLQYAMLHLCGFDSVSVRGGRGGGEGAAAAAARALCLRLRMSAIGPGPVCGKLKPAQEARPNEAPCASTARMHTFLRPHLHPCLAPD